MFMIINFIETWLTDDIVNCKKQETLHYTGWIEA